MSVNRQLRSSRSVVGPYNVVLLHHMYNYLGGIFRALDVYPGDPGSNPIRDVDFFFFQNYASFLIYKFIYF